MTTISEFKGALARLMDAYSRDRTFTDVAAASDTGGPALAAHLLYTVRNDGQVVLDAVLKLIAEHEAVGAYGIVIEDLCLKPIERPGQRGGGDYFKLYEACGECTGCRLRAAHDAVEGPK